MTPSDYPAFIENEKYDIILWYKSCFTFAVRGWLKTCLDIAPLKWVPRLRFKFRG